MASTTGTGSPFEIVPRIINKKNYYTDFLKRDDQILAWRLQEEEKRNRMTKAARDKDRALAKSVDEGVAPEDVIATAEENVAIADAEETELLGTKTIVIHPGSQNLRIGLATDALPKTVPMVIARLSTKTEDEEKEPLPKRADDDFITEYNQMANDFKINRRNNKRRVLPNSRELVTKWNLSTPPETISEHNDPMRVDWTETDKKEYFVGNDALRIPQDSRPKYELKRPMKYGWLNENDYSDKNSLLRDFFLIIEDSVQSIVEGPRESYSCVFIIPDLYEKAFVAEILQHILREAGFSRVCFIQESLAATFGAGYSSSCIVDVGASKTSICCVEEGMCVENSRINLKYGGEDVTSTFMRMMIFDKFHYQEINLNRRHDWLLAEELKQKFCTLDDSHISVQLYEFHLRESGKDTRKYQFKVYDEVMLAAMGFFRPAIFDHSDKLKGRHSLLAASEDLYDGRPNDPMSQAQLAVVKPKDANATNPTEATIKIENKHLQIAETADTPKSSSSPAGSPEPQQAVEKEEEQEKLPIMPLDQAIITSIMEATKGDERKTRDFFGGIMVIGGASKTVGFNFYLEGKLRELQPQLAKEILVGPPPRELDPSVLVWKGGSVFGKLRGTNDSWIGQLEFDRLGARMLNYKCMWAW
ncbi:hypothetical protein AAFC00_001583 [Neodothiora populina]|uniref:Actin-related protein 8 n=1 Tax=Neodothiora populina TaxID=2781224 RepID=A0ABR3PPE0_9PEZI